MAQAKQLANRSASRHKEGKSERAGNDNVERRIGMGARYGENTKTTMRKMGNTQGRNWLIQIRCQPVVSICNC